MSEEKKEKSKEADIDRLGRQLMSGVCLSLFVLIVGAILLIGGAGLYSILEELHTTGEYVTLAGNATMSATYTTNHFYGFVAGLFLFWSRVVLFSHKVRKEVKEEMKNKEEEKKNG